jgi:hypothetical protein
LIFGTRRAIVYLPLHRSQAMSVTEQTLTFGFRAATTNHPADLPALAAVAGLDLMQARRHAAVLARHLLAADLAASGPVFLPFVLFDACVINSA